MTQDAGDETGQQLAVDLRRVATDIALGRYRTVTRQAPRREAVTRAEAPGAAAGAPADGRSSTFMRFDLSSEQARDDVLGELRARGVEAEALGRGEDAWPLVIAERDRGQAVEAARDATLRAEASRRASAQEGLEEASSIDDQAAADELSAREGELGREGEAAGREVSADDERASVDLERECRDMQDAAEEMASGRDAPSLSRDPVAPGRVR